MTHNDTAVRLSLNIDISFTSSVRAATGLYIIVVSFKLICLFYISCISVIKAKCNRARSLGPWSLGPRSSGPVFIVLTFFRCTQEVNVRPVYRCCG